jgi:hypothetical protein
MFEMLNCGKIASARAERGLHLCKTVSALADGEQRCAACESWRPVCTLTVIFLPFFIQLRKCKDSVFFEMQIRMLKSEIRNIFFSF